MNAVLDAGALIGIDRGDRRTMALLRVLQQQRTPLRTSAAVVAQVWRHPRQVDLARMLRGVGVEPLGPRVDRRIGRLLAATGSADVVDGHVALLVEQDGTVLTADPGDLSTLIAARAVAATVVTV